ncbi:MAG: hypothetical protein R3F31_14740 [Verrucomicrobiales bacterium]
MNWLLTIVEEIDAHGSASLTRLTVLKKWFEHPGRLPAFGLWVAKRAAARKEKPGRGRCPIGQARLLGTTATRESFQHSVDLGAAKLLRDRARDFQNKFEDRRWGPVRIIPCPLLLLVEEGLTLYLRHTSGLPAGDTKAGHQLLPLAQGMDPT